MKEQPTFLVHAASFSILVQTSRLKTSFTLFRVAVGCFHARTFPRAPLTSSAASARKTWLPRSADFPCVYARLRNSLVSFYYALFCLCYFIVSAFHFFYTISPNSLDLRTLAVATGYPESSVTHKPISFDPNRLSLGHSFQKRVQFSVTGYFAHCYSL